VVEFSVRVDPFNVITVFSILDIPFLYNTIFGRLWIHMIRVILSTHHQLLKYPTPSRMTNIKGDQAMTRTVIVARKRSRWTQKASRVDSNEDFLVDKKQKRIVDQ